MSGEQNIALLKGAVDAINARNPAALAKISHPEFKRHDLAGALPEVSGTTGAADIVQLLLRALPDLHFEIKQIFATDDRVAVHLFATGTHKGELLGVPGTGKRVEIHAVNLYRVLDGRIAETWQLLDVWGLMRQMGKA